MTNNRIKLCFKVKRKSSDSFPVRPTEAAPMAMDCGDIILPVTPPDALALTVNKGSTPIAFADVAWSLEKRALEEVSEPVRKTPNQPRIGEKKGKKIPVEARAIAMVMDIPELLVIKANPTMEAMVMIGYFNWIKVERNTLNPSLNFIPIRGSEIIAASKAAVPALERKLKSNGLIARIVPSGFKMAFCNPGM
jgi:hypothetical protein